MEMLTKRQMMNLERSCFYDVLPLGGVRHCNLLCLVLVQTLDEKESYSYRAIELFLFVSSVFLGPHSRMKCTLQCTVWNVLNPGISGQSSPPSLNKTINHLMVCDCCSLNIWTLSESQPVHLIDLTSLISLNMHDALEIR